MKVGLTGNLYCGMEDVIQSFKKINVPIFDADVCLKFLLNYNNDVIRNIRIQFGESVFSTGILDHNKFNTKEKFDRLLDLVELELIRHYELWRIKHNSKPYTIFKSSILFERKLDKSVNFTINIFRPREFRIEEIRKKTSFTMLEIDNKLGTEMNELSKNQQSSYIIHNYTDAFITLDEQVKIIDDRISSRMNNKILSNSNYIDIKNLVM